jgi:hypothetical protein
LPGSWWFICKLVINYVWIKENWWSITYMLNTNKKIRNCGIKLNYLFDFLEPSLIYLVSFVRSSNPWMYYLIYNDDDSFSLINYRFLFFSFDEFILFSLEIASIVSLCMHFMGLTFEFSVVFFTLITVLFYFTSDDFDSGILYHATSCNYVYVNVRER